MKRSDVKSALLLLVTAVIWGMAFVSQSKGMEFVKPLTFMASRNFLATVFLLPFVIYRTMKYKVNIMANLRGGAVCGIVLAVADFCQQYGILNTTVAKAGFITALYIIFTPLLGVFIHKKVSTKVWICAVIAITGMYFISITDGLSIGTGDIFVFMCAILFAIHILVIDGFGRNTDGVVLSFFQFAVCFAVCFVLAMIFDKPQPAQLKEGIIPILYAGILSSGIGYTLQTVGQKGFNPTAAALILSLESVIAAISGVMAYRFGILNTEQSLTQRQMLGCIIVFAAVILVQLPDFKFKERKINCDQNSMEKL